MRIVSTANCESGYYKCPIIICNNGGYYIEVFSIDTLEWYDINGNVYGSSEIIDKIFIVNKVYRKSIRYNFHPHNVPCYEDIPLVSQVYISNSERTITL